MPNKRALLMWRSAQILSLGLGLSEIVLLWWRPALGIHLLWNVLIPLAPLVVMLVPGIWRNVCPLGVASQLPRRLGLQSDRVPSTPWQVGLIAIGWIALVLIVPMRHPWLDRSGPFTAMILTALGAIAFTLGLVLRGKSGWCSTLCPVHIVEKLYGQRTMLPVPNAHCEVCTNCVTICPDRQAGPDRLLTGDDTPMQSRDAVGHLMIGGFVGFVYGWFQCPDFTQPTLGNVLQAYAWPMGGMAASLAAYLVALWGLGLPRERLSRIFAAAAIAMYYWYRIPMLFGFGQFGLDGCLVDLSGVIPATVVVALKSCIVGLVAVWLVLGLMASKPWMEPVPSAGVPLYIGRLSNAAATAVGGRATASSSADTEVGLRREMCS